MSITLRAIGIFQAISGIILLLMPTQVASLLELEPVPVWAYWLFAMMGARFLGFACGMFFVARQPDEHRFWIAVMVGIQVVDFSATIFYCLMGYIDITLVPVVSVLSLSPIFIIVLVKQFPRHVPVTGK